MSKSPMALHFLDRPCSNSEAIVRGRRIEWIMPVYLSHIQDPSHVPRWEPELTGVFSASWVLIPKIKLRFYVMVMLKS